MARKFDLISELYNRYTKLVVSSPENWQNFLSSACRNYKLRFDEQLLVYAQRPDATAILEIEKWNRNLGRWVNRGATGIAVFEDENREQQRLIYYFDVSDTHAGRLSRPVPIWHMKPEYTEEVISTLESTFGELTYKDTLIEAIVSAAENAVEDNIEDYLDDLLDSTEDSFLEGLDRLNVSVVYRTCVTNSVAYMVMARLGLNPKDYFDSEDFRDVTNFTTHDTLTALGVASSDIAEMGLAEISRTIFSLEKKNRIIDKNDYLDYNKDENKTEGSFDNGKNQLHDAGRLSSAEFNDARATESGAWQIRRDEEKVFEGASQGEVLQSSNQGETNRTSSGSREKSQRDGGNYSSADGITGGSNRESKSSGYDELDSEDEQYQEQSAGNSESGSNLRLEYYDRSHEDNSLPFFGKDEDIHAILMKTPYLKATKGEIRVFLEMKPDLEKKTEYIKSLFNNDYTELILDDGRRVGYKTMQNVLHMWEGSYTNRTAQSYFDWGVIASHFEGLRLLGELHDDVKPLPSMEGQMNLIKENAEQKRSAFSFSQELIDTVLCRGSGVSEGKMRIYEQFSKSLSANENVDFLKDEYGWGGSFPVIIGTGIDEQHDGKGIRLQRGFGDDNPHITLSWSQVEKRIAELIKLDRYLNPKEKAAYPEWANAQQQRQVEIEVERKNREILAVAPPEKEKKEDAVYEYHLGDTIYIGSSEYEILAFNENTVRLYDISFPLLNKEFSRAEFDEKVKENPLNNHLIVKDGILHESTTTLDDYNKIKEQTPDSLVLYQVGDFFELYGEDAKTVAQALDISLTTRNIPGIGTVSMCGIPSNRLDPYMDMLTDRGYDLVIAALNDGNRHTYNMPSNHKEKSIDPNVLENNKDVDIAQLQPINDEAKKAVTEAEPLELVWEKKKTKAQSYDIHQEIPMADRVNFNLTEHPVEEVSKKERFRRNLMAIQLLKKCESENRFATSDEQLILSKYVGWGGIPEAFDSDNSSWATEYLELKTVLDADEYDSAKESTLTAFYTPPEVISAVYKSLENMGFQQGNLLEPSCGIGHFIGMLPEKMKESKVYGVELDKISASIAQQLYQKNSIVAQGYEETNLPDSFFDVVIGNVPFGDFKVLDKRYAKQNFLIHDYFMAKSLDKLRPGGVMALITSKGTMDKENPAVRKYIAQRADLLGAIRLPNDTFKGNAGTEVISDILIFQKRDRIVDLEPDWVHLNVDENGRKMNSYFVDHPEMVLGEWKTVSGRFGQEDTVFPYENSDLAEQLDEAISNIHGEISAYEHDEELEDENNSIPADPMVRNFSYTIVDDKVYYRENSTMIQPILSATTENRIKGMIEIRDIVRDLIELQTEDFPNEDIKAVQKKLNDVYDKFTNKYGLLNDRANKTAFSQDSSYSLLSALEVLDDEGKLERKADMFSKRTIKPHIPVNSVDTASEAFALSMGEKAMVDMEYMCALTGKSEEEIYNDLKGVIFLNPMYGYGNNDEFKYLPADEYLSGNVREKMVVAKRTAQIYPEDYTVNVEALEKVQPKELSASEISVRLGATWLPQNIVEQFIFEFLDTPRYAQWNIKVHFSKFNSEWNVEGKSYDRSNVKAYSTYGTSRINAYRIIEETLNLRDVRIFDYIEDENGNRKAVINKKETAIAQSKQELIKQGFKDWIWSEPSRREQLTKIYNEKFNSIRPREYDGRHIEFVGMNPEIELREHQKNAVAHILYGGNTLLAHCVGAGKTFEMTAAAMESKRLGLCSKSLFVVPNHLTEQWAAEFLQLYPSANILVANKRDFETKNRKRFCGRIATGDYDAIIIGHSQFEKIPMSIERQRAILEQQLEEVIDGIADLKRNRGDNFSVKQMEKTKKSLKLKLEKLNDQSRKDDVVTFEELGVDRLFIDESHFYKNRAKRCV